MRKTTQPTCELTFDWMKIPFHQETLETFIRNEIHALSVATKTQGDQLPVNFEWETDIYALAYFTHQSVGGREVPRSFTFNMRKLTAEGMSAAQIRDIVRHEFAHYLRLLRYGPCYTKEGHDKKWEQICVELGCQPERYHHAHVTQRFF